MSPMNPKRPLTTPRLAMVLVLVLTATLQLSATAATAATVTATPWSAEELASQLTRRLEAHPVLRAEFVQEKQMAAFKKPLVTRGHMVLMRGEGLVWKIEAPLKLTYVLSDERIVEIGENARQQVRTAQDVPGIAQVGKVFRALLGAQTATLKEMFSLSLAGSPRDWKLSLVPKPGVVAQFMRQVELAGGDYVTRIRIEEANGDQTVMTFRNFEEDAVASPEEQRLLGLH